MGRMDLMGIDLDCELSGARDSGRSADEKFFDVNVLYMLIQ